MAQNHFSPPCSPSKPSLSHLKSSPSVGFLPYISRPPSPPKPKPPPHSRSSNPRCPSPTATSPPYPVVIDIPPIQASQRGFSACEVSSSSGTHSFHALGDFSASPTAPSIRSAILRASSGLNASPPLAHSSAHPRGLPVVGHGLLVPLVSSALTNLSPLSLDDVASEGAVGPMNPHYVILGSLGSFCSPSVMDSIPVENMSGRSDTSAAKASVSFFGPSTFSLVDEGTLISANPLPCPHNPSREEQPRLQKAADAGPAIGLPEGPPGISWSSVVKQNTPGGKSPLKFFPPMFSDGENIILSPHLK